MMKRFAAQRPRSKAAHASEIAVSYIAGRWRRHVDQGARRVSLYDPSLDRLNGELVCAGPSEVDEAVRSARSALLGPWRSRSIAGRAAVLTQLISAIERRQEAFAAVIASEMGAPIDFARQEQVAKAVRHGHAALAALMSSNEDLVLDVRWPEHRIRYEPVGVAALITPWNWPLNQIVVKVAAALAAGCAVVLKPSELTPGTSLLFADCVDDTDLPMGVFNMVLGDQASGSALACHPGVNVVSFTGSTATGRQVARSAAEALKPVVLELGGKSANVVFADVEMERAVGNALESCFRNSGQTCNAGSRLLVERSAYDRALGLISARCAEIRLASAHEPGSHLGPVVSRTHQTTVLTHVENAAEDGAVLICGGEHAPSGPVRGSFVRPTVFADVTPKMRLFRDEVFGPVLAVTPFDTEEEAIALANDSPYGLTAYVQSADLERADRVACALDVGMVQVNGSKRLASAPFGGRKCSGMGSEAALWGIRSFQVVKSISGVQAGGA